VDYARIGNIFDITEHLLDTKEFFVDLYPFTGADNPNGEAPYSGQEFQKWIDSHLYHRLGKVRETSLEYGKDYWIVVQSFGYNEISSGDVNFRYPTPKEVRLQVYSALTHGAKGVWYFMYSSFLNYNNDQNITGIVDYIENNYQHSTEPFLSMWNEIQAINSELSVLGPLMMDLTSTHVFNWTESPPGSKVVSVTGQDLHFGEFIDSSGIDYLMAVNRDTENSNSGSVEYYVGGFSQANVTNMLTLEENILIPANEKVTIPLALDTGSGILLRITE